MKPEKLSDEISAEYDRLDGIWVTYPEEISFDIVVKEHGTEAFKKYYFKMMERHNMLRKKGIIIN